MQAEGDDSMSAVFVTLDPILNVNPLEFADWCATKPTEPSKAPTPIDARWSHHVSGSSLDAANLLFVLLIDQDEDGRLRPPLDEKRVSREAFGRMPNNETSLDYMIQNVLPTEDNSRVTDLLFALNHRFDNHACSTGTGGMILRGALSAEEGVELRITLQEGSWRIHKDEIYDGAVSDLVRLLIFHLRAAERRGTGILLREHR